MHFKTPYMRKPCEGLFFDEKKCPSRTKQSFKDESDLNVLVKRFTPRDLQAIANSNVSPMYGDVSDIPDFQSAQNNVRRITEYFEGLPSDVRNTYGNSVSEFVSQMSRPENADRAVELGFLASPQPAVETPSRGSEGVAEVAEPAPVAEPTAPQQAGKGVSTNEPAKAGS